MCEICDELIKRTRFAIDREQYGWHEIKVLGNKFVYLYDGFDKMIWFYECDENGETEEAIERCPKCKADLQYKWQQASVSEKPNNSKKLGDFTLREIQNICNDQINGCSGCPLCYVDCDSNEVICPKDYWCDIDMEVEVQDD